ncbi:MAG: glucoamylase family protein, partial [Elusimicrobiota bacterium]
RLLRFARNDTNLDSYDKNIGLNKMIKATQIFLAVWLVCNFSQIIYSKNDIRDKLNVEAKGFDKHIYLKWDISKQNDELKGYNIYRSRFKDKGFEKINDKLKILNVYSDWIGKNNQKYYYQIETVSKENTKYLSVVISAKTYSLSDDEFLTSVQEAAFHYFYEGAHPVSGLARERYPWDYACTTGGTGMGLMVIIVGVERGFITRKEGGKQALKILRFMSNNTQRYYGAWAHWLDGESGDTYAFAGNKLDNGGDIVETSYLMMGLLTAQQYFNADSVEEKEIQKIADALWKKNKTSVNWKWYLNKGNTLIWHWSKEYGWEINLPVQGFNETMIVYLLAIACPNEDYNIPVDCYKNGWALGGGDNYLNDKSYYGVKQYVSCFNHPVNAGMPLFWLHYSFMAFDPRGKNDGIIPQGVSYFDVCRNISLIDNAYCSGKPHEGYSSLIWGLTAGYEPRKSYGDQFSLWGYGFHWSNSDNGTINPTGMISSIVYTPEKSIAGMRYLYDNYGDRLWGEFGFKDAFNLDVDWFSNGYLAINQAPIVMMIENYRTELIWKLFMSHPDIKNLLEKLRKTGWEIN